MTLSIAIAGAAGRMGRALVRAAHASGGFTVVGGTERPGGAQLGADIGALAGCDPLGVKAVVDAREAAADADIWIDFTSPTATLEALDALASTKVRAAIVGTTGFTADEEAKVAATAQRIALVRSGNFSLGVHALAGLVRQAAQKLGAGWDIEIIEAHHWRKRDAPSGTALMLAEAAAQGRTATLEQLRLPPRDGVSDERPEGGIGFSSIRAGGIVGEHDVVFASEREVLTLSHQALDRAVFADGALAAARWAAEQKPGLYAMKDVLNFQ
jgi:4-hydroxy-tetrahydrodipicolinate reductase